MNYLRKSLQEYFLKNKEHRDLVVMVQALAQMLAAVILAVAVGLGTVMVIQAAQEAVNRMAQPPQEILHQ